MNLHQTYHHNRIDYNQNFKNGVCFIVGGQDAITKCEQFFWLSTYSNISIYLPVQVPMYLNTNQLFAYIPFCLFMFLPSYLSIFMHLPIYFLIYQSIYLSI